MDTKRRRSQSVRLDSKAQQYLLALSATAEDKDKPYTRIVRAALGDRVTRLTAAKARLTRPREKAKKAG